MLDMVEQEARTFCSCAGEEGSAELVGQLSLSHTFSFHKQHKDLGAGSPFSEWESGQLWQWWGG